MNDNDILFLLADYATREYAAWALDSAGLADDAARLRALTIADASTASAAEAELASARETLRRERDVEQDDAAYLAHEAIRAAESASSSARAYDRNRGLDPRYVMHAAFRAIVLSARAAQAGGLLDDGIPMSGLITDTTGETMTHEEAISLVENASYEPESYEEAAEIFTALYGRAPDEDDGDQGQVWSLCCAYGA